MKRRFKAPSPSLIISLIALFVALGGTTYAATTLPKNSVGTKQLKKNAVTTPKIKKGAVTAAKINAKGLTVPNALHATSAGSATNASHAANADSASNASQLGGHAAGFYAPATLQSGHSESGDWSLVAETNGDAVEGIAFPTPLASPLDSSHVAYLSSGTTAQCPGPGQAAPGYLCVYASAGVVSLVPINSGFYTHTGAEGADPYGFILEFFTNGASNGSGGGVWTVTAP